MDFFQERKLLVAWRRTNEISGENLTNVFARTYTRRRIAPIPVQSFQSFRNFREKLGADRNGRGKKKKGKEKNRYRRSFRGDSRLSRREPAIPPRSRKPILFPG